MMAIMRMRMIIKLMIIKLMMMVMSIMIELMRRMMMEVYDSVRTMMACRRDSSTSSCQLFLGSSGTGAGLPVLSRDL